MTMKILLCLISAIITSSCFAAPVDPWGSLNAENQALVNAGKQVLVTEKIKDYPWPYFHIYRLVNATPVQVAAVFWDVENTPHFIPHCLKAAINASPVPNIIEVDYELQIPFFSNEVSKVRNILKSFPRDDSYEISWEVLHSKYGKSGKGSFLVVPHGPGTLICYSNFVDPGSIIAPLLQNYAEKQVQETVAAIATQIEYEVKSMPEQLLKQEEQLRKALEK